jgi:hypothetical protein
MKSKLLFPTNTLFILFAFLFVFTFSGCEKEDVDEMINSTHRSIPEIDESKKWFDNELKNSKTLQDWEQIYSPGIDWKAAKLVVSSQKDTVIEVPYRIKKNKYEFGLGHGSDGKNRIEKLFSPHVTRLAISVKDSKYNAKLMYLFCDTMMVNGKKAFYDAKTLSDINFANSYYSSPKHAVLMAFGDFDGSLDSFKYYELGKVKSTLKVGRSLNSRQPELRDLCYQQYTIVITHYSCIYNYCTPYYEYQTGWAELECNTGGGGSPDEDQTSPSGEEGTGTNDTGNIPTEPDPCTFPQGNEAYIYLKMIKSNYTWYSSQVVVRVNAKCSINSNGSIHNGPVIYLTGYGGQFKLESQTVSAKTPFVGRGINNTCQAYYPYVFSGTVELIPSILYSLPHLNPDPNHLREVRNFSVENSFNW